MSTSTIGPAMNPEQYAGVVEQRFRNIEGQVTDLKSSLSSQISAISAKMDERSKPQWQLLVSAIGVMMTILVALGALIYLPIKNDQAKTEFEINKLREQTVSRTEYTTRQDTILSAVERIAKGTEQLRDTTMSRNEIDQRFITYGQRRDDTQKHTEARLDRLQRDIDSGISAVVPRGEHERVWHSYDDRDKDLQRQLDEIKKSYENVFSLRDALQAMQKRIDSLEALPNVQRR
jgi:hypothetical protein